MWDRVHLDRCSSDRSAKATGPIRSLSILAYPEVVSALDHAVAAVAVHVEPPRVVVAPAVVHPAAHVARTCRPIVVHVLSVAALRPVAPGEDRRFSSASVFHRWLLHYTLLRLVVDQEEDIW